MHSRFRLRLKPPLQVFGLLLLGLFQALWVDAAPLQFVVSLPSLAALVVEVGGPAVQVRAMASPRQDPHFVDARPDLILHLARADLLVLNGLGLESGWLPALLAQSRNARIQQGSRGHFDASRHVTLLQVHKGPVDRTHGDIHKGGNPHFLVDPRAGARVARALGETIAALDPQHAASVRARAQALAGRLETFATQEAARFARLPAERRAAVVYHDSLPYLLAWLGIRQVATLEPRPGIAPHPQHVAAVLQAMRQTGTRVLVQEAYYPRNASDTVARLAGGVVVVLPGGAQFEEGQGYEAWLRSIATSVYGALAAP